LYRVLIVDDELPFLQSLKMFDWEANDCRCVGQASNGQEALDKCHELAPHIVITDINMPLMDGLSFLVELNQRFPEIQVILLTVHRDFEYAQRAVNLNACDYLIKDMDYQRHLPYVLEKAKKPFEQQPSILNYSANLLHRSGHMLVIESDDALYAYHEEVDRFLDKYAGTLITAKLRKPYNSLHSLISQLDLLLSSNLKNVGLIVRNPFCFEVLIKKEIHTASGWLRSILEYDWFRSIGNIAHFALISCGNTVQQYIEAHNTNSYMLERSFYTSQPRIVISRPTKFETLPSAVVDDWMRRSEVLGGSEDEVEKFINEVVSEAEGYFFFPHLVRRAFDRILYKHELRYAANSDEMAHFFLLNAPDIRSLADKLQNTVKKIREQQSNYSYYIVQATEYMRAHLKEADLQLKGVAEYVGISPGYLSKKLKDEAGQTFQEMLISMRMEYAAELLTNSDMKVYEIAELVGYENYRSFTMAFTNYYGVSPKKYHKSI
jgi:two-component system response regulator YesN